MDQSEQNEYTAFESHADLVIGIDFGTTFSGVAYALTGKINPGVFSRADRKNIADKVVVVRTWPGGSSAEKIPSVLSYKTSTLIWGPKVKNTDEPRIAFFKLGLEETVSEHYKSRRMAGTKGQQSALGGYLTDPNWYHPRLSEKKALDFAADYLTAVCEHIKTESLRRLFGVQFLQRQQISYVITVPAIWSDKAKELTRQAAYRAGIQRRQLMLITEPEAAALYCATLSREVDLETGDRFLICDAGGGTVVRLPCHYCTNITGSYFLQSAYI